MPVLHLLPLSPDESRVWLRPDYTLAQSRLRMFRKRARAFASMGNSPLTRGWRRSMIDRHHRVKSTGNASTAKWLTPTIYLCYRANPVVVRWMIPEE
jgi:hypothetical protein